MMYEAILAATPWRCFHCDFITNDRAEAEAHFGDIDDASEFKPLCRWWKRLSEDERIQTLQDTVKQLNEERRQVMSLQTAVEGLEYRVGTQASEIASYKPFRDCRSIYDIFCVFDSMEGRALVAEERLRELTPPESA